MNLIIHKKIDPEQMKLICNQIFPETRIIYFDFANPLNPLNETVEEEDDFIFSHQYFKDDTIIKILWPKVQNHFNFNKYMASEISKLETVQVSITVDENSFLAFKDDQVFNASIDAEDRIFLKDKTEISISQDFFSSDKS